MDAHLLRHSFRRLAVTNAGQDPRKQSGRGGWPRPLFSAWRGSRHPNPSTIFMNRRNLLASVEEITAPFFAARPHQL